MSASTCAISVQYGVGIIRKTATKDSAVAMSVGGMPKPGGMISAVQVLLKLSLISAIDFTSEQTVWVVRSNAPNDSVSIRVEQ